MSEPTLDIAIIGAGPGGYVAAIRAAQLGLKVAVIEMDTPGGVCLNWGCIPSKNLIQQAEDYHVLHTLEKLGGGAIGCEFAFVMNAFGVALTVVEMAGHLLPTEDFECAAVLQAEFEKAGIKVHTDTRATGLKRSSQVVSVALATPAGDITLKAEKALVVFGRRPNTEDLGLETVGLKTDERGFIPVDDYNQTSTNGVFAIGDVTSTPLLAHVASREGELAVEFIAGHGGQMKRVDPAEVPSAIYCEPQVAGFGLREDEAKSRGIEIRKSVFPYRGIGKAVAVGKPGGLVKIIADPDTGEILGGHVVGLNATEILHEILLAKTAELLPEDITRMIHAHPTLSEGVMEAALGLTGAPIHM